MFVEISWIWYISDYYVRGRMRNKLTNIFHVQSNP